MLRVATDGGGKTDKVGKIVESGKSRRTMFKEWRVDWVDELRRWTAKSTRSSLFYCSAESIPLSRSTLGPSEE